MRSYGPEVDRGPRSWLRSYALDPATDRQLHRRILDWAVERARALHDHPRYGRPSWYVNALAGQRDRIDDLHAKGFADQAHVPVNAWSKVLMMRPAAAPHPASALPPGYRLRALGGQAEVADYVTLHREVFLSESMTAGWRSRVLRQPAYLPDLDLVIEAPDASLAAFCVGWFDPAGFLGRPCGQIEPLGVGRQHRGLGLAKALLGECLRRLHAQHAEHVYVETDNYRNEAFSLYESVGFCVLREVHVFRQDL